MNNIKGLEYIANFITNEQEESLLQNINNQTWENSLKRKVQQYGMIYNYSTKKLDKENKSLPDWLKLDFSKYNFFPDQIIINQYLNGEGITKHIDSPVFDNTIAVISLLSNTNMMIGQYHKNNEIPIFLERKSLLVMSDEVRNNWYHFIPAVKEKRISITFRKVLC